MYHSRAPAHLLPAVAVGEIYIIWVIIFMSELLRFAAICSGKNEIFGIKLRKGRTNKASEGFSYEIEAIKMFVKVLVA